MDMQTPKPRKEVNKSPDIIKSPMFQLVEESTVL